MISLRILQAVIFFGATQITPDHVSIAAPAVSMARTGLCPMFETPAECPGVRWDFCTDDSNCVEGLKCCNTGCENDCVVPDHPVPNAVPYQVSTADPDQVSTAAPNMSTAAPNMPITVPDQVSNAAPNMSIAGALEIKSGTRTTNKIFEGKPVELACYFSGWPLPHEVHWYKDGELIINETEGVYHTEEEKEKDGEKTLRSTLHLPPGREEQEGFYKCSARNSIPSSASFEIKMIYECPLAKGVANHSSEIRAPKSSNVSLSCWIDYDDFCPGELLWKFNDKPEPLPESSKKYKYILKDTNTKCQKEFILSIFDVTESDEGAYSCHRLCEYENPAKAAIDLKVADDLQTALDRL